MRVLVGIGVKLFDRLRFRNLPLLLSFLAVVWVALVLFVPSARQDRMFFSTKAGLYCFDYFNARAVASAEHPYQDVVYSPYSGNVQVQDQCYPALTYAMLSVLPESYAGAICCQLFGVAIFLTGVMLFFRKYEIPSLLPAMTLLVSSMMLLSLEVANTIVHVVGAAFVFLAWYDSESRIRRAIAALSLAFAVVLKITPVFLGLVYLLPGRKFNWRGPVFSGIAFLVMLLVPFSFYVGIDGFLAWVRNAGLNSNAYAYRNGFGWYGLVSALLSVFGYGHDAVHLPLRIISSSFAVLLMARAFIARGDTFARLCLLSMGMLFFPPTMMGYALLYVIPLFVVGTYRYAGRVSASFAVCWFVTCVPLQIPLLLGSLNVCFIAAATLDVCFVLWKLADGKTE